MIYLDNNATTKIDPRVFHVQFEILNKQYGNPSSLYPLGTDMKNLITKARMQVANLIGADLKNGDKIIFTGCATESNNAVLHSVLYPEAQGKHIIISVAEHPSILNTAEYYKTLGCRVTKIGVDENGVINEQQLLTSITSDTLFVSIVMVNSETGVIQDVQQLTKKIRAIKKDILIHTDAVQAAGKIPINVKNLDVDFLTLSGHKFNAPKGVGALYIKKNIKFIPFMHGGHQEDGFRAGTENTASIVAMGAAAELANKRVISNAIMEVEKLRNSLEQCLEESFDIKIAGKRARRVGNTCNVGFKNIDGSKLVLLLSLKGICVSSGTACNSISAEPSEILKAMKMPKEYIQSIRISLSSETTKDEIVQLINTLKDIIEK